MTESDKAKKWMAENAKAFECWNRFVERHGLPLAQFNELGRVPDNKPTNVEAHGLPLEKERKF